MGLGHPGTTHPRRANAIAPTSVDEILRVTDQLMYDVKSGGKNGIRYSEYLKKGDAQVGRGMVSSKRAS